jgi:hypothetical protein
MKVDVPCRACGGMYIRFVPLGRGFYLIATCEHCGAKALPALSEESALQDWIRCQQADAYRQKQSLHPKVPPTEKHAKQPKTDPRQQELPFCGLLRKNC